MVAGAGSINQHQQGGGALGDLVGGGEGGGDLGCHRLGGFEGFGEDHFHPWAKAGVGVELGVDRARGNGQQGAGAEQQLHGCGGGFGFAHVCMRWVYCDLDFGKGNR